MYHFWGKVGEENKRGRTLRFPTANINLSKKIPEGIYVSITKIAGKIYKSITFIGTVKTFGESKFHAETYILDFKKDIYDQWISVKLLKKLRENIKFQSSEKLIAQMKKDEQDTRDYFRII